MPPTGLKKGYEKRVVTLTMLQLNYYFNYILNKTEI